MGVRVSARRLDGYAHEVEVEGHTFVVDEPTALGGTDTGPSPGRLLAASLASCTAVTMELYAERKGWDIGEVEVDVDATYEEGGHVAKSYDLTVRLPPGLDEERRERLFRIAKKCPVHRLLAGEASIEIRDELAPEEG